MLHGFVCMVSVSDEVAAVELVHKALPLCGYRIATVDDSLFKIPGWRALLPTQQGKSLRTAVRFGIELTLSNERLKSRN